MKIKVFKKRLNRIELGKGNTHDRYIAVPSGVDLSNMFEEGKVITPYDVLNEKVLGSNNNICYKVHKEQNNQHRISGLGKYYDSVDAEIGDEISIRQYDYGTHYEYDISFNKRHAIVFQKLRESGFELLTPSLLPELSPDNPIQMCIKYRGIESTLLIQFNKKVQKRAGSESVDSYDLQIDNKSLINEFAYQEYLEIVGSNLQEMKNYAEYEYEWGE